MAIVGAIRIRKKKQSSPMSHSIVKEYIVYDCGVTKKKV